MSVTATVEEKGRIVIPSSVRKRLGIRPGTELEVDIKDGGILMRPKRKITVRDLRGIAGKESVKLEDLEESLGAE